MSTCQCGHDGTPVTVIRCRSCGGKVLKTQYQCAACRRLWWERNNSPCSEEPPHA